MTIDEANEWRKLRDRLSGRGACIAPVEPGGNGSTFGCVASAVPDSWQSALMSTLEGDVRAWLSSVSDYFTNERHLQVELAIFLENTGHYARVFTEYRVPLDEIYARRSAWKPQSTGDRPLAFPWPNQISLDIVVCSHNGRFAAIELKYATRSLDGTETLFGEPMLTKSPILKNQAANNLTMYNYWKDVRRLEAMTEIYDNVEGGIALMVGNSRDLWAEPRSGALYTPFSTHEGRVFAAGEHRWPDAVSNSIKAGHPDFATRSSYVCSWSETPIEHTAKNGDRFRRLMTVVK